VRERMEKRVCVCEGERAALVVLWWMGCVNVCVCERERERERESERARENKKEREREREREST